MTVHAHVSGIDARVSQPHAFNNDTQRRMQCAAVETVLSRLS